MLIDLLLVVKYLRFERLDGAFFFLDKISHAHPIVFKLFSFLVKLGLVLTVEGSSHLLVAGLLLFTLFILHSVFDDFILELLEQVQET